MFKFISILCLLSMPFNVQSVEQVKLKLSDIKSIYTYRHKSEDKKEYLSNHEISDFTTEWNASSTIGLCKYAVNIWLVVESHSGDLRTFRVNDTSIKENNDMCYRISKELSVLLYERAKNT